MVAASTKMEGSEGKLVEQWYDGLERGANFDSWGQVIEAVEEYEKLAKQIRAALDDDKLKFTEPQARFLNRTMIISTLRAKAATDLTGADDGVSLDDIRSVAASLKVLPNEAVGFPVEIADIRKYATANAKSSSPTRRVEDISGRGSRTMSSQVVESESEGEGEGDAISSEKGKGTLLPRPEYPGQTVVAMKIDKIEIKDVSQYIMPFFTISVKDSKGNDLCPPQDTPQKKRSDSTTIYFEETVYLQIPLEKMPEDVAVFFEFKHYKPKKAKVSVRCYSFMELDEIQTCSAPLELYKKPTDFKRKGAPNLLTSKKHYLYISCTCEES